MRCSENNSLILMVSAILIFLKATLSITSAEVWVIPAEIKINPMNGEIVGENGKTIQDIPAELQLTNTTGVIPVRLIGNLPAYLQIVIPHRTAAMLRFEDANPAHVQLYQLGLIRSGKSRPVLLPDVLIPLEQIGNGETFDLHTANEFLPPERIFDVIWLEISFPAQHDPLPGIRRITFLNSDSMVSAELTVELTPMALSLSRPLTSLDLNEYGDKYLIPFGKDMPPPRKIEIEREIFRFVKAHGGVLNPLPYKSQKGTPGPGMVPALTNADLVHPQFDWSDYDARFGPYFDGSAFEDGQPLEHFYLPFNPNWPAPFELYFADRERYEEIWAAVAREYIRHFREKGWSKTLFQVYCNQKPNAENKIPWNLDEPKGVDDYRALRYFADLTHRVFGEALPVQVQFRIDISHFYCEKHRGSREKDFRVNRGDAILEPVDIWVISRHSLQDDFPMQKARELRRSGKQVWIYSATPRINESGMVTMNRLFNAWLNQLNGLLIWKTFAFQAPVGDGSDHLLYVLPLNNRPTFLPSIRMMLLKKAIDETQILQAGIEAHRITADDLAQTIQQGTLEAVRMKSELFKRILETH